jgi:hypothetical protein
MSDLLPLSERQRIASMSSYPLANLITEAILLTFADRSLSNETTQTLIFLIVDLVHQVTARAWTAEALATATKVSPADTERSLNHLKALLLVTAREDTYTINPERLTKRLLTYSHQDASPPNRTPAPEKVILRTSLINHTKYIAMTDAERKVASMAKLDAMTESTKTIAPYQRKI